MWNRKLLIFCTLVILTAVIVYFALNNFQNNNVPEVVTTETGQDIEINQPLAGKVTEVNLEQIAADGPAIVSFTTAANTTHNIALPSMGRLLCAAKDNVTQPEAIAVGDTVEVLGAINESGEIIPCEDESHYLKVNSLVSDNQVKIEFPYRIGPNGYIVQVDHTMMSSDKNFVKGYEFMLRNDYIEMQNVTIPREGPPTITMRIYKNTDKLQPAVWAENNPLESNSNLAFGEKTETTAGGAEAVRYTVNGLYNYDTYVINHDENMYVFSAAYIDEKSPMPSDLEEIIGKLKFIE